MLLVTSFWSPCCRPTLKSLYFTANNFPSSLQLSHITSLYPRVWSVTPALRPGSTLSLLALATRRQSGCGWICPRERSLLQLAAWSTLCATELTWERSRGWKWESGAGSVLLNRQNCFLSAASSNCLKIKRERQKRSYFSCAIIYYMPPGPQIKQNKISSPRSASSVPSPLCLSFSSAIMVSHQRAAGWWMSCRLPCQPKVSSIFSHVNAGLLKTGEMAWLPGCSMC